MKTYHKPIPILSLFALLLLFVWACRKEKPAFDLSDKDPCSCASEVSAEFDIHEVTWVLETLTDNIFGDRNARFTAHEEDAEYTWYIGSEVLTTKSVTRFFNSGLVGMTIPITLVVRKEPNSTCFPDDDGYDSIVKYMKIFDRCAQPHILEGTFRFAENNSSDSVDIKLERGFYSLTFDCENYDIDIMDGGTVFCSGYRGSFAENYREIKHHSTSQTVDCPNRMIIHLMRMNYDNSIFLDISYLPDHNVPDPYTSDTRIRRELFGRKL